MIRTSELKNELLVERMKKLSGIEESAISIKMPPKLHDRQVKYKKGYDDPDVIEDEENDENEELDLEMLMFELELDELLREMGYENE